MLTLGRFASAQDVEFTNMAIPYGLNYQYLGLSTDGCGISLLDHNEDGRDDLSYATQHGMMPAILHVEGDTLISSGYTGLEVELDGSRSIVWVDYDNDGDKDLCLTNVNSLITAPALGTPKLYRRDGPNTLVDVTFSSGWGLSQFQSYSAIWADYDNDGWLDCYVSHRGSLGTSFSRLLHNQGDGTFVDVAEELNVMDENGLTYTSIFFDYDLDGDADLYTANDKSLSVNRFYENNGDGTFTDISVESGIGAPMDGMGIAMGDVDNNGYLDLYVANTSFGAVDEDGGNRLYLNMGNGEWISAGDSLGVEVNKTCWGMNICDLDLDGDQDLIAVSEGGATGLPSAHHDIFIQNNGVFDPLIQPEILMTIGGSFGTAIGDVNDDGYPDLAVANTNFGQHELWINQTQNSNHWLKFNLEGSVSNRDAIGSLVSVYTGGQKQIRYTTCGNSYGSQDSDTYIMGLGAAVSSDSLIVNWPSGHSNVIYDLPSGRRFDVLEDTSVYVIDCVPNAQFLADSLDEEARLFYPQQWDAGNTYLWTIDGQEFISDSVLIDLTPGIHEVCLRVTSSCTWMESCSQVQIICSLPVAEFGFSSSDLILTIDDLSSADTTFWTLNGTAIDISSGYIEVESPGTYEICAAAVNSCGVDSLCQEVQITCPLPTLEFTYSIDDLELSYESMTLDVDSILWSFGDGSTSSEDIGVHTYTATGEYELSYQALNSCGVNEVIELISISCPETLADFDFYTDSLTVFFEVDDPDGDLQWTMGDGAILQGVIESYTYANEGAYEICLMVEDDCGSDTACVFVFVSDGIVSVEDVQSEPIHVFPNPFTDEVIIEVKDPDGCNEILLTDGGGRRVARSAFKGLSAGVERLSLGHLSPGVYYLTWNCDRTIYRKVLIKN